MRTNQTIVKSMLVAAVLLATAILAKAQGVPGLTPFKVEQGIKIGFTHTDGQIYYLCSTGQEAGIVQLLTSAQLANDPNPMRCSWDFCHYYEPSVGYPWVALQNTAFGDFLVTSGSNVRITTDTINVPVLRWIVLHGADGRVNLFHLSQQRCVSHFNDPLRAGTFRNFTLEPSDQGAGDWYFNPQPPSSDTDGDGVTDDKDAFPNSILTPTVVTDDTDTGVPNTRFSDGSTISDQIAQRRAAAKNHGQFVSAVAELTNWLKSQRIITGAQKAAIDSAAAKSSKP